MRLFIAIPIPYKTQRALQRILRTLPLYDVRLTPTARWHLTLVFLGEQETDKQSDIVAAMRFVGRTAQPFECLITSVCAFGHASRPHLAAIVSPERPLMQLHAQLHGRLAVTVTRHYQPHISLGQLRAGSTIPDQAVGPIPLLARELLLIRSVLSHNGARYTILERIQFGS